MTFSLLTMEPSRQMEILGKLPGPTESAKALTENGAVHVLITLSVLYLSWLADFEPCPRAQELFDLLDEMSSMQSSESFMNAQDWKKLRSLAKLVLDEAGLPPWPVPSTIDFHQYVEIHGYYEPPGTVDLK